MLKVVWLNSCTKVSLTVRSGCYGVEDEFFAQVGDLVKGQQVGHEEIDYRRRVRMNGAGERFASPLTPRFL